MNQHLAGRVVIALAVFVLPVATMQEKSQAFAAEAQASSAKATAKATSSRGVGDDPNIKGGKQQAASNDPAKEAPAPPQKGGAKTRGLFDCYVTADNYTSWWIDIYVDGTYRGQVSPWGAGTVNAGIGGTTLYGRAEFNDGSVKTWGPRQFLCTSDGRFNWRLDR
jgi:hypothetical protein